MAEFLGRYVVDYTPENVMNQTVQESLNLKTIVSGTTAQHFRFNLTLQESIHDYPSEAIRVFAEMAGQEFTTFDFPVPQEPVGNQNVTSHGAATVNTENLTVNQNHNIKVGRFISFSGHNKLYIVRRTTLNNITVYPRFVSSVNNMETLNLTPTMKAIYEEPARLSFSGGRAVPIVRVREAI